jgi:beta-lactamase regulating signal transducer with metallopeptidase domain
LATNSDPGRGVAQFANGATGVAARVWALATWSSGAAWLAGVLWLVWRRWRTAAQLRHIVRDELPVDARAIQESLSQWPSSRRMPAILSSRTLPVPIVCGVLRPRIIVPESLLRPESAPLLTDVFLHELSHVLRRDPLAAVIQWLATVLYWPHPLIHVVSRQLSAAREDLCDNFVLQHRSPADYSRTLLQLAEGLSERRLPSAALAMLPRWSNLEARVAGLLDPRRVTGVRNLRGRGRGGDSGGGRTARSTGGGGRRGAERRRCSRCGLVAADDCRDGGG